MASIDGNLSEDWARFEKTQLQNSKLFNDQNGLKLNAPSVELHPGQTYPSHCADKKISAHGRGFTISSLPQLLLRSNGTLPWSIDLDTCSPMLPAVGHVVFFFTLSEFPAAPNFTRLEEMATQLYIRQQLCWRLTSSIKNQPHKYQHEATVFDPVCW